MDLFKKSGTKTSQKWLGYAVGLGLVVIATWLKFLAQPDIIPANVPILYFVAIVPTAIFFGFGPSILVCVLSLFVFDYFFIPPLHSVLDLSHVANFPILAIFLAVGILFSSLTSSLRNENQRSAEEIEIRKKTEYELTKLRDHLEDLVGRRTRELNKSNINLQEDITQRKKTEQLLESALQRVKDERNLLRTVMNSAGTSHLVYLDRNFNFILVNEAYAKTCGYSPEEMVGKNHFALYPHGENETIFTRVRDTGIPEFYHDKPFEFPDQPERGITYWDWTLTPVKNIQGTVDGLVFSLSETTDRKKAEQALETFNSELEHHVIERTSELTEAHTKLLEQLKLRVMAEESARSLATRLLHIQEEERRSIARELHDEVGQSLTVLKMLIGKADRSAPEEVKPILKDVSANASEIMKQVRDLSRSLRPGVLDELGLIPALETLFKQLKTQADIQVHFDHQDLDPLTQDVNITAYRITQEALTNFMRHSGIKEVFVRVFVQGGTLWLNIEDHGQGFDQSTLETTRSTGLSAMKERAALVGGKCAIESEPGKGTRITVTLPLLTRN